MRKLCAFTGMLGLLAMTALAGDAGKDLTLPASGPFDRGTWEVEGGAGFFGSFSTTSAKRPTINYQMEDLRLGWMYDSPRHSGWLRGNNEFLLEVFAGPVTKGPGNFLAGGSPLWRYNFVQPDARWVPYFQIGAGALGNNIYKGRGQREIGEGFEFVLQGDVGLRYMISDQWSVSAEAGYRHISNADLASRNEGLNSLGGLMQVSYRFH
jgi:lipid A 3-O-deacylase